MSDQPSDWQGDLDRPDLDGSRAPANPLVLFSDWYDTALGCGLREPKAMTLATVDPDGQPSARIVLIKGFDETGFRFYTNYHSRKGMALAANPRAALVFWWEPLERQIRITGAVDRLDPASSDDYFSRRPRASQIGVHASRQSQRIAGRPELEQRVSTLEKRYQGHDVPRPPHWGGYVLKPDSIEFWQARHNRLHDRLRYYRNDSDPWQIERLSP